MTDSPDKPISEWTGTEINRYITDLLNNAPEVGDMTNRLLHVAETDVGKEILERYLFGISVQAKVISVLLLMSPEDIKKFRELGPITNADFKDLQTK